MLLANGVSTFCFNDNPALIAGARELIVLHLELIKLQLEYKVLYLLFANVPAPVELVMAQVDDYFKMR